jgi:hypothetical protein
VLILDGKSFFLLGRRIRTQLRAFCPCIRFGILRSIDIGTSAEVKPEQSCYLRRS